MRRDLVLTAKHVLDEAVEEERPIFLVNGSDEGRLTWASLRKLYSHPEIVSENLTSAATRERDDFYANFVFGRSGGVNDERDVVDLVKVHRAPLTNCCRGSSGEL
jgi:hypothetical protein